MSQNWYVEIVLSDASDWVEHSDPLIEALAPLSGTLGGHPMADLSVRVAVEAPDAIKAVQVACTPVMDALLSTGMRPVIRSTEVLTEAEMNAFLASP
jgi:hypothetical protein